MDLDIFVNDKNVERLRRLSSSATTEDERVELFDLLGRQFVNVQNNAKFHRLAFDVSAESEQKAILDFLAKKEDGQVTCRLRHTEERSRRYRLFASDARADDIACTRQLLAGQIQCEQGIHTTDRNDVAPHTLSQELTPDRCPIRRHLEHYPDGNIHDQFGELVRIAGALAGRLVSDQAQQQ